MKSSLSFLFLLFLVTTVSSHGDHHHHHQHQCAHDTLDHKLEIRDTEELDSERRVLATWESIRIILDFSTLTGQDALKAYITQTVLPPVASLLSASLKVKRLTTKLTAGATVCGSIATPAIYSNGGVDADLVIFVLSVNDPSSSYIATAGACTLAPITRRPMIGKLTYNLAYTQVQTNDAKIESDIYVTMHEITHVLAFSSSLYQYYVNPADDVPLTGHTFDKTVNGGTVKVLNVAPLTNRIRTYFNCPTIEGAYIENEGGSGSAGSHFERRIFFNEYMTASAIKDQRFTQFALALLEGSGWYQPDYSYAEPTTWGKNKGCAFFDTTCINIATKQASFEEFCSPLGSETISFTKRGFGMCVDDAFTAQTVPSNFDYWGNGTKVYDTFSDNCPWISPYSNKDCEDSDYQNAQYTFLPSYEYYGYGGKGFLGTLGPSGASLGSPFGYCFKTNCVAQAGGTYQLQVLFGASAIATCTAVGAISPPAATGAGGVLYCPDPTAFCNQIMNEGYCKGNCWARGSCVNRQCVCNDGWAFHDCRKKQYVDNCARCAGKDPLRLTCYGDECVCNPSDNNCMCMTGAKTGPDCAGVVPTCTGATYVSGSQCKACPATCATCSSDTVCGTCNSGYGLQGTMCSTCPTNNYLSGQTCKACPATCATCTSDTVC